MLLILTLALSTLLAPIKTLTILPPLQSPATLVQSSGSPLEESNVATPVPADVSAPLGDISTTTNVSIAGNNSNTANESASGTLLSVNCDGNRYGSNLNIQSCKNIFRYISKNSEQTTFANRHTGIEAKIELPWRIYDSKSQVSLRLSGKGLYLLWAKQRALSSRAKSCLDKSLCFVQPVLRPGKLSAQASSKEIGNAAFTLMHECAIKRGVGGIAANIGMLNASVGCNNFWSTRLVPRSVAILIVELTNVLQGGDNNLLVAIAKYEPKLKCNRKATPGLPWSSCRHIWGTMETGLEQLVFGDEEDPDVQVDLPYELKASESLYSEASSNSIRVHRGELLTRTLHS